MYQFTGVIKNELRPEPGVNVTIKGLEEDRIILAPTGPWHEFDKKQDDKTLTLSFTLSTGTTEYLEVTAEVSNGKENITTNPDNWEVQITSSSESDPTNAEIVVGYAEVEEEEEEEK